MISRHTYPLLCLVVLIGVFTQVEPVLSYVVTTTPATSSSKTLVSEREREYYSNILIT